VHGKKKISFIIKIQANGNYLQMLVEKEAKNIEVANVEAQG
jgi:hypothetical protein